MEEERYVSAESSVASGGAPKAPSQDRAEDVPRSITQHLHCAVHTTLQLDTLGWLDHRKLWYYNNQ